MIVTPEGMASINRQLVDFGFRDEELAEERDKHIGYLRHMKIYPGTREVRTMCFPRLEPNANLDIGYAFDLDSRIVTLHRGEFHD